MPDTPPDLSVVLPAFNEQGFLTATVTHLETELAARDLDFEIVVVENGSTDATASEADDLVAASARVRLVRLDVADYGLAVRTGLLEARAERVVQFDVDYYDLGFLDRALARMDETDQPVVVVGSKRSPDATDQRSLLRRTVTAAFGALLRFGFGLRLSDTHGMKVIRRDPLLPLIDRCVLDADMFDTELIIRAERAGLVLAELPVVVNELRPSRTSIIRRGARTVGSMARLWWILRRR